MSSDHDARGADAVHNLTGGESCHLTQRGTREYQRDMINKEIFG